MKRTCSLLSVLALIAAIVVAAGPASAADTTAPVIKNAVMADTNRNDHADRLTLTYSEPINHVDDKDGVYPFSVAGYAIKEVAAATNSKKLVIRLVEQPGTDIAARPQLVYTQTAQQPVVDLASNQAAGQTFKRTKPLDLDGDGYTVADGDCAPKDPSIHPNAPDEPDLAFVDSNCDGIDGTAKLALFVSPSGSDSNPGTQAQPLSTIEKAIEKATVANGVIEVYAAVGTYGPVILQIGVRVYGGYDPVTWARPATGATTIVGGNVTGPSAAYAQGATAVTLQLLTLHGTTGSNAYGLLALGGSDITLDGVTINADAGADGGAGTPGSSGTAGAAGTSATSRPGGAGGSGPVPGGAGGTGGLGLGDGAPGAFGAGPGGGAGGAAGTGGDAPTSGAPGDPGLGCCSGSPGSAGTSTYDSGGFVAGVAGQGGSGSSGSGGGGGGGGGGFQDCADGDPVCHPSAGGGGGGGGAGGSGGQGGWGGSGGGASIGIYAYDSQITITAGGATITTGDGGAGGAGGHPGFGGAGGYGGAGHAVPSGGSGGPGAPGSPGGPGGQGGGGAGGPSIGIFHDPSTTLSGSQYATISVGSGGTGGAAVNAGPAGVSAAIYP